MGNKSNFTKEKKEFNISENLEMLNKAIFGGGCFWCT